MNKISNFSWKCAADIIGVIPVIGKIVIDVGAENWAAVVTDAAALAPVVAKITTDCFTSN